MHVLNVFRHFFFLVFTLSDSFKALHLLIPDFIAAASFQQVQSEPLHSAILASKAFMLSEHVPVNVVLIEIFSQLVEMVLLQLARMLPLDAAVSPDLVLVKHEGVLRSPPTTSVRITASFWNIPLLSFFFFTILAWFLALFSCFLKLKT